MNGYFETISIVKISIAFVIYGVIHLSGHRNELLTTLELDRLFFRYESFMEI